MTSEIVSCARCGHDYELYYDDHEECVGQTKCACVKQTDKIKPLDRAIQILNRRNYETNINRTRKISHSAKTSR